MIIIFLYIQKRGKKNKGKTDATIDDSKNSMNNNGALKLTLKSNPPPRKENIVKLQNFLDLRRQ